MEGDTLQTAIRAPGFGHEALNFYFGSIPQQLQMKVYRDSLLKM